MDKFIAITRIREQSKRRGILLSKVAESIGKKPAFFYDVEHGKQALTLERVEAIAKLLEVNPKYFTGEVESPDLEEDRPVEKEKAALVLDKDSLEILQLFSQLDPGMKKVAIAQAKALLAARK